MRLAVIVPFLDEARAPARAAGVARRPDAPARPARARRRRLERRARRDRRGVRGATRVRDRDPAPVRPAASDRLAGAHELRAFAQGLTALPEPWDVVAKLDADLRLPPGALATIEARFLRGSAAGHRRPLLRTVDATGRDVSHHTRPEHVEGAAKFYRRDCWEAIAPLPPILGWDTIDEVRARMHGWRTAGGDPASEPVLHLRPDGCPRRRAAGHGPLGPVRVRLRRAPAARRCCSRHGRRASRRPGSARRRLPRRLRRLRRCAARRAPSPSCARMCAPISCTGSPGASGAAPPGPQRRAAPARRTARVRSGPSEPVRARATGD